MKLVNGQKIDAATMRSILANSHHTCTYEGSMNTDMSADKIEDGDTFTVLLHLGASVQFHLDSDDVRCHFSLEITPKFEDLDDSGIKTAPFLTAHVSTGSVYMMHTATGSIDTLDNWQCEEDFDSSMLAEVALSEVPDHIRLTSYGFALYGRTWKTAMAEDLNLDARRITHWIQGTRPVPAGVWADLQKIARNRLADIQAAADGMM